MRTICTFSQDGFQQTSAEAAMCVPLLAVERTRRGLHLPVLGVAGVPAVASAAPRGLCPVADIQFGAGEAVEQG